jgi:hypothetical protein
MDTQIIRNEPSLKTIDPFEASIDCLLVVAFPKTTSKFYSFAVNIASGAERYAMVQIEGKLMHVAAFGKTQVDAGRASALLGYIQSWRGAFVFVQGKAVQDRYRLPQVINCFLQSCQCRDTKAHCHTIIDDPLSDISRNMNLSISLNFSPKPNMKKEKRIDLFTFPCKYLFPWFHFQRGHPSTFQDQIQAAGVEHMCNVCPHFSPDDFRKTGYRSIEQDVFD